MTDMKPHKKFKVTLTIEAWDWKSVLTELRWLQDHLQEHGSECSSVMGGGSRSHTVMIEEDPDMTEEQWEKDLDAYLKKTEKKFPLLLSYGPDRDRYLILGCPMNIPWSLIDPHELRAEINHKQTLKRLASRGGLSPKELVAVLQNRPWREVKDISKEMTVKLLKEFLDDHKNR